MIDNPEIGKWINGEVTPIENKTGSTNSFCRPLFTGQNNNDI